MIGSTLSLELAARELETRTPPVVDAPPLIKVSEVAKQAGVTPQTVYRDISNGVLSAIREGRWIVVRSRDAAEYVRLCKEVSRRALQKGVTGT